jgi:hypothetical protein
MESQMQQPPKPPPREVDVPATTDAHEELLTEFKRPFLPLAPLITEGSIIRNGRSYKTIHIADCEISVVKLTSGVLSVDIFLDKDKRPLGAESAVNIEILPREYDVRRVARDVLMWLCRIDRSFTAMDALEVFASFPQLNDTKPYEHSVWRSFRKNT